VLNEMNLIKELLNDEQGAALAEYALLVALISVGTIGTLQLLGGSITSVFTAASTGMATVTAP
jgi:Flp pilus assembly pilin Flp